MPADGWMSCARSPSPHANERHPYEVPRLVAMPFIGGSRDYFDWIDAKSSDKPHKPGQSRSRCACAGPSPTEYANPCSGLATSTE